MNLITLNNERFLAISIVTLLLLDLLGSIAGIIAIVLTPIFIGFVTYLILYKCNYNLTFKTIFLILLILFNDILIRLYGGGDHDFLGNTVLVIHMLIGLLIFGIIFLRYGISNKLIKPTLKNLTITAVVIYFYLYYFGTFGMISK